MKRGLAIGFLLLSLAGCDTVDEWLGSDEPEQKISGERIAILSDKQGIAAAETADIPVNLSAAEVPNVWLQFRGNARHQMEPIKLAGDFSEIQSATAGEGEDWVYRLVPSPVIAGGKVFSIDASGVVSAHALSDVSNKIWEKDLIDEDEALVSAGLAIYQELLLVTLSDGEVIALHYPTGQERWRKNLGSPLRNAPSVDKGRLFIITADNQLFTLDANSGKILWQHRGILESASLLGTVVPAAANDTVIAAYTSGEIYALSMISGKPLWMDSLILPQRTAALSAFSGIGGSPVIGTNNLVYTLSQNGLAAANDVRTGTRAWERPITSFTTPWLSGDQLYIVTSDGQVAAVYAPDGRVQWKAALPKEDDENPPVWSGPYLIGKGLYIFSSDGKAYVISAETGKAEATYDFVDGIVSAPAFAQGKMFILDEFATLHVFQ